MRLLHTSDWHLGRAFGATSLHDHQAAFLDWLVGVVRDERVDLVVVAGDVFDRPVPPVESMTLYAEVLSRLRSLGAVVVVVAGNHDGPERLPAYDRLTDASGVYVRGGYQRAGEVLHLDFADGSLDVVAVPYLDPGLATVSVPSADTHSSPRPVRAAAGDGEPTVEGGAAHDAVLAHDAAAGTLFESLAEVPATEPTGTEPTGAEPVAPGRRRLPTHEAVLADALQSARAGSGAPRSLAVAHAFVTGGEVSDSERQLTVGGTGQVSLRLFEGFSYTALGHLHRPQGIGGPTVRYSGSPLPYSFSETHPKQVVLVDLDPLGVATVRPLPVPVGRRVVTVRGTIDEVLGDPAHDTVADAFVRAVLTDRSYVVDARARLAARFPHVVEVLLEPTDPFDRSARPAVPGVARARLAPVDAAAQFWSDVVGEAPDDDVRALLTSVLDQAVAGASA